MFEIVIVYYISNLCIACFQHNNSSEDEMYEEDTTFQYFPPFMATFRKPKSDIAASDKKAWLESGYEECKASELMPSIIEQMFDFEIEESKLEQEVISIPEKMALVFNYMDSFFQIQPSGNEESFKKAAKMMNVLRRFYDKKACLNGKHTESIIDVFRYCVRKDQLLSRSLEKRATVQSSNEMKSESTQQVSAINPQHMDLEVQSKMDLLLKKKPFTTSFEDTFDALQGDGLQLLNEFVDWPVAGEVYSYNDLKNELCGDAKFKFDPDRVDLSGLV